MQFNQMMAAFELAHCLVHSCFWVLAEAVVGVDALSRTSLFLFMMNSSRQILHVLSFEPVIIVSPL